MNNLIGQKFNRLLVIDYIKKDKNGNKVWVCRCDCGNETTSTYTRLKLNKKKSCGCLYKELRGKTHVTHGKSKQGGAYNSWIAMRRRCYYIGDISYKNYGARGITVCDMWLGNNGFKNFIKDMGERPTPNYSFDRFPNINGNYEPSNCRWATRKEQARGKRSNVRIEYNGTIFILQDLANKFNISSETLRRHLKKKTTEEAINYCINLVVK